MRTYETTMHGARRGAIPPMLHHVIGLVLLIAIGTLLPVSAAAQDAAQDMDRLRPGDRVAMRVLAWNTLDLQFQSYDALGGTYTVAADGTLMLPLLPPIVALDKPLPLLADLVSDSYRIRLGLSEPPAAMLEMAEYRPIFVLGDVTRPGRYDYEPGLTPLQALALAGGIYRDDGTNGAAVIRALGTLREVGLDQARERMRAARLHAEMADRTAFDQPDLPPHPGGAAAATALFERERDLFIGRQDQLRRALASIDETRDLLGTEILALEGKRVGITRQLALVRESLGNLEVLRERGLARSPALLTLQGTLIDLEARELDTETGIFRARQQLSELDRDAGEIEAARRVQVLQELLATDSELLQLDAREATTRSMLTLSQAAMDGQDDIAQTRLEFSVVRDGDAARLDLDDSAPLRPLDVLTVRAVPASN
ncbi:MAG: hypothetical protein AAGE03_01530 [Pseudomonadota bacterium]